MLFRIIAVAVALASVSLAITPAAAQERKAGDRLAYTIHMTGQGGKMGTGGPGTNGKLTLTLDRIEADGSAHATAALDTPGMPGAGSAFEVMISRAGEILPKADPGALKPHMFMSKAEQQAMAGQAAAMMLQMNLRPFNAFAAACASRGALHVGESWHAPTDGADMKYTVTGREQRLGREAFAVRMTSAAGAQLAVTGQGYYDPEAHLVVSVRTETKMGDGPEAQIVEVAFAP
jgi:hypothetical protein